MITQAEMTDKLATGMMGWHQIAPGLWDDGIELHDYCISQGQRRVWRPLDRIAHAEQVNDAMALRKWHLSMEGSGQDWRAQYSIPGLTTATATGASMAEAICLAAGRALKLWD